MAGTYSYHSHIGFQAVSAAGPLFVDEDHPPYDYDGEKIMFLSDVFWKTNAAIETGLISNLFSFNRETAMTMVHGM